MYQASLYDFTIIGGGIVGLATALALTEQFPGKSVVILEKESRVAAHQTGHNSGVIHSGIYYKPGSLKAKLCVDGARRMYAFCTEHDIKTERVGKVIIATQPDELPRLETLYERGIANGVLGLRKLNQAELREIEPHAAGIAGIHAPNTGIVNYKQVCEKMRARLEQRGACVMTGAQVTGVEEVSEGVRCRVKAYTNATRTPTPALPRVSEGTGEGAGRPSSVVSRHLINCGGLHSDLIAQMAGASPDVRIIPFRGEYFFIKPEKHDLVRGLIYPVPDPNFPFLGVHFTRTVDGEVEAGPNAVFAFAREGYTMGAINLKELWSSLSWPGFAKMARKWWRVGGYEIYRSLSKQEFVRSLQKLVPAIQPGDIVRGGAGVRAQAIAIDGALLDDFKIIKQGNMLHVLNAPSPAATASLAIGEYIAQQIHD